MSEVLSRQGLPLWLDGLLEQYTIVAPVSINGLILFRAVDASAGMYLDSQRAALSPKAGLFPPTETLFSIRSNEASTELLRPKAWPETVIFGVRPCDALGITLLDYPFLEDPADSLYQERRAKTVLVGLACSRPGAECFCTSVGTAPDDSSHMDIMLTEVAEGYGVEVVTERGRALLGRASFTRNNVAPPPTPALGLVPTDGLVEAIRSSFDSPYWERLADRCLHCNLCAYVCPTCYCFDIRDYPARGGAERVRAWESCQSAGFTRIAGGHDPRASKGARLRQRFAHKLLYFPERYGALACTGCGRCIRACPVNIDIREVILDLQSLYQRTISVAASVPPLAKNT